MLPIRALTPIPPEIIGWMRGFAETYRDLHRHAGLSEAVSDNAGSVLINFHVQVMASEPGHSNRFFGVDRIKIATRIVESSRDDETDWAFKIDLTDPLWRKVLCGQLSFVAESLVSGAQLLFETQTPPLWTTDLLASGFSFASTDTGQETVKTPEVVLRTEALFLKRRLQSGVVTETGHSALMALARRHDEQVLPLLEDLVRKQNPTSDAWDLVLRVLLAGQFGFEGQQFLEGLLREQSFRIPFDRSRDLGMKLLQAVLTHRSGWILLKLLARNPWLDDVFNQSAFRDVSLYLAPHHFHLLEPLARDGRSVTLRRLLRHPDLLRSFTNSGDSARVRAIHALIAVYHQAIGDGDRDAVAEAMERINHEMVLAFFRQEIFRLGRMRSAGQRLRSLILGTESELRSLLQRRADRMAARNLIRSA